MRNFLAAAVVLGLSLTGMAQQNNPSLPRSKPQTATTTSPAKLTREQKFVIDTVKMAVALPESDPQDRLRVLSTAADVVSPIDKKMARGFWHEGARIETDLVRVGQTPAVSMMSSGLVDCAAAVNFVENLPDNAVLHAEQSLIGAVTSCPKADVRPRFPQTRCWPGEAHCRVARVDGNNGSSRREFCLVAAAFCKDV